MHKNTVTIPWNVTIRTRLTKISNVENLIYFRRRYSNYNISVALLDGFINNSIDSIEFTFMRMLIGVDLSMIIRVPTTRVFNRY